MEINYHRIKLDTALFTLFLWLSLSIESHSLHENHINDKTNSIKSNKFEEDDVLSGLELPIPPKIRQDRGININTLKEEIEIVPQYIRLPNIGEIQVVKHHQFSFMVHKQIQSKTNGFVGFYSQLNKTLFEKKGFKNI